jgi:hypothetical protein
VSANHKSKSKSKSTSKSVEKKKKKKKKKRPWAWSQIRFQKAGFQPIEIQLGVSALGLDS